MDLLIAAAEKKTEGGIAEEKEREQKDQFLAPLKLPRERKGNLKNPKVGCDPVEMEKRTEEMGMGTTTRVEHG